MSETTSQVRAGWLVVPSREETVCDLCYRDHGSGDADYEVHLDRGITPNGYVSTWKRWDVCAAHLPELEVVYVLTVLGGL